MRDDMILLVDQRRDLDLEIEAGQELELESSFVVSSDYEKLKNIPEINGRQIIGKQTVAYYLQDGLIIDGGTAQEVTP